MPQEVAMYHAGSGANALRLQVDKHAPFVEPENEETDSGASQGSADAPDWRVKVQCWGPTFWQGTLKHCNKATRSCA
jgi:hypothetical protein